MSAEEPKQELLPLEQMEFIQKTADPVGCDRGHEPVVAAAVTTQPSRPSRTTTTYIEQPPNHMVLAFTALCLCSCCWPALVFAIMGILFSFQVDSQWFNKDYAHAQRSSRAAMVWSILAIVAGIIVLGLYALFYGLQFS